MQVTLAGLGFAYSQLKQKLDMHMLMNDLGDMLRNQVDRRFEAQISPSGKPWPKSWRVMMNQGGQTLSDSGKFRKSFTYEASNSQAQVGTNWPWAKTHHYGAKIKPKNKKYLRFPGAEGWVFAKEVNIPARPVLGFSEIDNLLIQKTVENHLKKRFT